jgi:transcriptional regulator with XRE-family HTH domain
MTLQPSDTISTGHQVNRDAKTRVLMDAVLEASRLARRATAGASNAIDDHTVRLLFGREVYDLGYGEFNPPLDATAFTIGDEDQIVSSNFGRYTLAKPVDLGGGITIVGSLSNPESVVEQLIPTTAMPVNVDPVAEYRASRRAATEGRRSALAHISKNLDATTAVYAQSPPQNVVRRLTDLGVNQLVVARALGVTPTAVRKWRRGESAKPEHRAGLARFAAMHSLLTETGLHDPGGWLEIPISSASTLTPLDLFSTGRADIVVLLGARLMEPQEALDAYDPAWREAYPIDPDYEVVVLSDGSRSAVPRRRGGAA